MVNTCMSIPGGLTQIDSPTKRNPQSMGISGSNGGAVPYKTIFCSDIPLHKPEK